MPFSSFITLVYRTWRMKKNNARWEPASTRGLVDARRTKKCIKKKGMLFQGENAIVLVNIRNPFPDTLLRMRRAG